MSLWTSSFPIYGVSGFLWSWFLEVLVFYANSLDPDQTPRSAASDLGLDCLQMSFSWDARHARVNLTL